MISPISSDTSCFRVNLELCLSGLSWTTYRTWLGLLSTEHFEWWQHVTLQKQNLHPRLAPSYAKLLLLPVFVIILNVAMLTAKRTEIPRIGTCSLRRFENGHVIFSCKTPRVCCYVFQPYLYALLAYKMKLQTYQVPTAPKYTALQWPNPFFFRDHSILFICSLAVNE